MNKYALRQTPLAVAIGTLLAGGAVEAATITVTTDADGPLGSITDDCTLRAAIASANSDTALHGCVAGAGADEIVFDENLAESTITLSAGEMEITGPLTITGPVPGDAAGLTIDGNGESRIFRAVGVSPSEPEVGLDSLTLTGGHTSTFGARGGAIYAVNANLSLAHVIVTGNSTGGPVAHGGGINVRGGNATLSHSTVSGNSTHGDNNALGGGLSVEQGGNATLINSTVSGNSTTGNVSSGGGLSVDFGGNATLINSTVSGNSTAGANARGGGLYVGPDSNVTLTHSTVFGNSTAGTWGRGGGLSLYHAAATLTHSTVAYNTAVDGTDGVYSGVSTLTLNNSLIVQAEGETACNQQAGNHTNTLATDGFCTGTATDVADIALGPLADNGGPTQTHALDAGSVAVNGAGDCQDEFGVTEDQRGKPRPGLGSTACDIGAYEFQIPYGLIPAALDFGATRVAATAGPLTMTLSNPDSTDNLEITGVGPITGPGAAVFAISADACTGITLLPGGSCDVGIEFTPDDRMQFDAQVGFQFASESAEAALTGTGIAPAMGLLPQTLDFGSVSLGQTGGPLSLEVVNSGEEPLEVAALLGLVEPFSLASSGTCGAFPFTLPPGGQCTLDLQFTPTVVGGAKQAVFVSSDSFSGDQAFALRGLGFSIDDGIFEDRFQNE